MDRDEKKVMAFTTASHSLVHFFEGVLPPLIPLVMTEFATDYFHLGLVVTVFSYAFGFGSLPAGYLADKVGPRRLITFYLFGASVCCTGVLAVQSLLSYGILMGFIGMFCSTYHPASNTLISHAIKEKGKGFGIHGIAGSLGVAVVPVLSAWMGTLMGWKAPHVLFGFLGIGVGIFSLSIPRQPVVTKSPEITETPANHSKKIPYGSLIVFFISVTGVGLTYKGIMTFLPAYMGESVQVGFLQLDPVALGGTVATLALLSGAVGQYIAGFLLDRRGAENLYLVALLFATAFVFLMARSLDMVLVISSILYAFFYFATQPIQNYLLAKYIPRHRQGLGYGILFFMTFGVGSTAAAICGYLADKFGLRSVFYFVGICFIVSAFLALILALQASNREKVFLRARRPGS